MEERAVSLAVLHSAMFVPGIGQINSTLDLKGLGKNKIVDMSLSNNFLKVTFYNKTTIVLPLSSVNHMILK